MTLAEVRSEIKHVKNRIACIITDQDRCPRRVYEEFRRGQLPLSRDLWRLRQQYQTAQELITAHEAKIQELSLQLKACMNAKSIKKMLELIRRMNGLGGRKTTKAKHGKQAYIESRLTNQRTQTLIYMINGYHNEIKRLERLIDDDGKKFKKLEEPLIKALDASWKYFERFMENKRRGYELLDEAYIELDRLRKMERELGGDAKVNKLSNKAQQLMELMLSMPKEMREMIQKQMENVQS